MFVGDIAYVAVAVAGGVAAASLVILCCYLCWPDVDYVAAIVVAAAVELVADVGCVCA